MESYEFLAGCYDELTTDVRYSRWADYIEKRRTPWKLRPEKKKRAAGASREGADK